jgi:hypothetical protein
MFIIHCVCFIDKKIATSLFHKDTSLLILMNKRKKEGGGGSSEMAPLFETPFPRTLLPYLHFYLHCTLYNRPLLARKVLLLID